MGLRRKKDKVKMRWGILPVLLLLTVLCISAVSSAEGEQEETEAQMEGTADSAGAEIFVNGTALVNGTGTYENPINNLEDAIAAAESGSIIWITGTVQVKNGEVKSWSIDPDEKPGVVVKRYKEFKDHMVMINGGSLELSDIVFDGNREEVQDVGCIVNIGSQGKFYLEDGGVLKNNMRSLSAVNIRGGAVWGREGCVVRINGGEISNNAASTGGGIAIGEDSVLGLGVSLEINRGEISNNESTNEGGGLWYRSGDAGSLKMTGGDFIGNYCRYSGGGALIRINQTGLNKEISGGRFYNNIASDVLNEGIGGGINIQNTEVSNVKAEGLEISNNKADRGGGISWHGRGGTISGCNITNNEARLGGGFYNSVSSSGYTTVSGGNITDNNAEQGGGAYVTRYDNTTFDSVIFHNNTASGAYFWTIDPSAVSGNSYHHRTKIINCTYSQGPVNEEKTVFEDFTNAFNNYDINYLWKGSGPESLNITKSITAGGSGGVIEAEENMTYQIAYQIKDLDGILSDVYVKDILPDGVELVSCTGTAELYDSDDNIVSGDPASAKYIKWNLGKITSDRSGTFTVTVKVLKQAGGKTITNKAGIIAEQEHQEKWDEASIEAAVAEIIEFTVPEKFDYGEVEIGPGRRYFGLDWQASADKEAGENIIAVEDTRLNLAADWKLYANLSGEVKDKNGTGNNILNDVLVYCEEGTESTLTGANTLIADKSKYGAEYNWISEDWYQDYEGNGKPTNGKKAKGLYMVLQPGQGSVTDGGSYKGEITWILAYTP